MTRYRASRFLAAAALSLLVHGALISGGWLRPHAVQTPPDTVLEARLAHAAPAAPPPSAQPGARAAERHTARSTRRPRAAPRTSVPPVATAPSGSYSLPESQEAAHPAEPPPPEAAVASRNPSMEQAETAPEPTQPSEPVKTLPRKGRIAYTAYFGDDRFTVGKTVQTWEVEGERYRLGSVSETTGIVELFRSQRYIYLSTGRFAIRGLEPQKFYMSRTRRGRTEAAQALFDRQGRTLTYGRVPERRTTALPPDAQDILSFMYQLALFPPAPGRMRLPLTNGSRFETYELEVREVERIETPLGILRALPVKQIPAPGDESVEIWLAVDYHYLPVRMRFFDDEGRATGEQIVDAIELSEE